jgi:hypothetical protein
MRRERVPGPTGGPPRGGAMLISRPHGNHR